MLNTPHTLDQMTALADQAWQTPGRLLAERIQAQALERNEGLGLMLAGKAAAVPDKRFANRLRNAKMRFPNASSKTSTSLPLGGLGFAVRSLR